MTALKTEGQLAGVLAHEIGHVIERHSNQQMAKQQFFQGLAAAGGIAGGDAQSARMAQAVAQMASMKYGRDDELQSDQWGVRLTAMAGYDPRAMIGVMKVLEKASGGGGQPEFMSTHPSPANREQHIEAMIKRKISQRRAGGAQEVNAALTDFRAITIISGGQTGADRAALDFAIANGFSHGGWCPRGRLAEDGPIPLATSFGKRLRESMHSERNGTCATAMRRWCSALRHNRKAARS